MTSKLTERQTRILLCIAYGYTDAKIADEVDASRTTVHRDILALRRKLGAANRANAVAVAYHQGILRTAASR